MKNEKSWKSFVAGMLTMAMVFALGIPALAAGSTQTLKDVLVGGIRIVIDGQELHPTDAGGNPVNPMIYNGTTYLPVRAVATALGKAVYWDGPTYTVYLGNMDGQLEYPTVMLKDMTSIGYPVKVTTRHLVDNYGNTYSSAVYNQWGGNNFDEGYEFLLNMRYSKFKTTLYIPEGEASNASVVMTINADGRDIYTSPLMTKSSAPIQVDANVTGYNDLKISFSAWSNDETNGNNSNNIMVCLADAGFYQ